MTRRPVHRSLAIRQFPPRHGQALVEFGIIAFVFTLLIAGILTFGLLLHGANVIQQAADVGAMEFSRLPLPPLAEFPQLGTTGRTSTDPSSSEASPGHPNVFYNSGFQQQIFDERFLVVKENDLAGQSFFDYMGNAPLINRLLLPVYITETVPLDGPPEVVYRYPGAIVRNQNTNDLTVLIPVSTGPDSFEWRAVIEEIRSNGVGPFRVDADDSANPSFMPGMVALRINYPFQSGAMLQYQYDLDGSQATLQEVIGADGVTASPVDADDESTETNPELPPDPYSLVISSNYVYFSDDERLVSNSVYSGRYGLGRMYAHRGAIRPYRKVLSAQGIYRREVFAP